MSKDKEEVMLPPPMEMDTNSCDRCHMDMSDKVMPVSVDGKKFCPQCFVWNYSHEQPERWHWNSMSSICCKKCGFLSVDFGNKLCAHCGDNKIVVLAAR